MVDVRLVVLDLEPSCFQLIASAVGKIDSDDRIGAAVANEGSRLAPVLEVGLPALDLWDEAAEGEGYEAAGAAGPVADLVPPPLR